jgi:hypothetical protein
MAALRLCLVGILVLVAGSQATGQSLSDKVAKSRECARVPTDPDSDMRLVGLQEILKTDDAECKERAIKAAMTVADPKLQAVALLGFLTSFSSITLNIVPPADLQELMREALTDPLKMNELERKNSFIANANRTYHGKLTFQFVLEKSSKVKVTVIRAGDRPDDKSYGEAFLRGNTIYGRVPQIGSRVPVEIELRIGSNGKIVGSAAFPGYGVCDLEGDMYP